jgi:hypothetical protein
MIREGHSATISVKGFSMRPFLEHERDRVVMEPAGELHIGDAVLAEIEPDHYVLHRIIEVLDDGYRIVGDNCAVPEFVREDQILGVMTAVVRDGKTIPVTDPAYQRYVHLWCDHFPIRAGLIKTRQKLIDWKRKLF